MLTVFMVLWWEFTWICIVEELLPSLIGFHDLSIFLFFSLLMSEIIIPNQLLSILNFVLVFLLYLNTSKFYLFNIQFSATLVFKHLQIRSILTPHWFTSQRFWAPHPSSICIWMLHSPLTLSIITLLST